MQIGIEINGKKEEIMKISSKKEKFFYHFLKGSKLKYEEQKGDLDDFVISVFSKSDRKLTPKKSRKDLNFIDKIAISVYNKSYEFIDLNASSIKEIYIVDKVFNKKILNIENVTDDFSPIDLLIKETIEKNISLDSIINSINNAEDLIDIFIIENAFSEFCNYNHRNEIIKKYTKKENRKSLLFWITLITMIYLICVFANKELMINAGNILGKYLENFYYLVIKFNNWIKSIGLLTILWLFLENLPRIVGLITKKEYTRGGRFKKIRDLF